MLCRSMIYLLNIDVRFSEDRKKFEKNNDFLSFSILVMGSIYSHAYCKLRQIPAGAAVRMVNCQIIGDRLNFSDILERAAVGVQ